MSRLASTLRTTLALLVAMISHQALAEAPDERPNLVIVMADDMGFSDIGCYGGEIHTPVLNQLAADGLRFTQFYNTARCCPTRASLLTGLYPHQAGIGHMMADRGWPGYRGDLNRRCATIAELLREAGYSTYMAGKWHVTKHVGHWSGDERLASQHNWPRQRGFEAFYGTIHGGGSFFDPVSLTRNSTPLETPDGDFYYTDAINDRAAEFVREHAETNGDRPFFLYVAHTAPHWPLHALPEDIARYRGRFDAGWDALRLQRYQRMIELGILPADLEPVPRDEDVPSWEEVTHPDWEARRMEVYAAQVDRLDQGLGRLVVALRETNQMDNTVFFFLADNGGCAEEITEQWSGLHIPETTPGGQPVEVGNRPDILPGPATTYQSYGQAWANLSNTPFRRYKHWVHEGGIASPLIVHWPQGIQARGALRGQLAHVIDLLPTCLDLAEVQYPQRLDGHASTPLEGKSLRPAFSDQPLDRDALFWEHEGNRAVRTGRWKLVSQFSRQAPVRWELYDMVTDRAETNDLATEQPRRVERMARLWDEWAERCGVRPWPVTPPTDPEQQAAADSASINSLSSEPLGPRFWQSKNSALQDPPEEPLWPAGGEFVAKAGLQERTTDRGDSHYDRAVASVSTPSIYVHRPPAELAIPTAAVVCPGGGYSHLAIDRAGHDVARWLNSVGITAIVLKYRLKDYGAPAPLEDVQQAIATVRHRAEEFGIRRDRIGIFGFSAGGHLAACAGTHVTTVEVDGDPISSRPDFMVLAFPLISLDDSITHAGARRNLLGPDPDSELLKFYSPDRHVTSATPPTFLIHALDDRLVPIEHSLRMYRASQRANVPVEFALYEQGGHGFGLVRRPGQNAEWPHRCLAWLDRLGLLANE